MQDEIKKLAKDIAHQKQQAIFLVAIDGCGGAGKSTVAEKLAVELADSQLVHVDDFYKPKEQRIEVTEHIPVHVNFEFEKLRQQVLVPLKHGSNANYQNPKGETITIKPRGYVIVEGLGTLGLDLKHYFDYKIWVAAPEGTRRRRGIERDSDGWTKIWEDEYLPQDARYGREQSPQAAADWTFNNG